jgi:hypothetical protein
MWYTKVCGSFQGRGNSVKVRVGRWEKGSGKCRQIKSWIKDGVWWGIWGSRKTINYKMGKRQRPTPLTPSLPLPSCFHCTLLYFPDGNLFELHWHHHSAMYHVVCGTKSWRGLKDEHSQICPSSHLQEGRNVECVYLQCNYNTEHMQHIP